MKVILHLTKDCNLRCKYCYAPSKVKESMSYQTGQSAIDLAISLGESSACISYFGGEPLLRFGQIRELTDYAQAKGAEVGKSMHFRISTNGTLFDEEILEYCRDQNILFAVSLDGDRQAHDAQRILPSGKGSFELIDEKLDMILEYNPYTVVTSVITPATVSRLLSSIEYMWAKGIRYFVHQLDYTHPDWTRADLETLADSYRQLAGFYLEKIRADEHFHLGVFDDKLKTHASSPIELGVICDFGAKKVSVAPNGKVYPCVQFVSDKTDTADYCIGDVDSGLTARREELIAENRKERSQCEGCALVGRCSNYCGCLNWQITGKLTKIPGILCTHEQMLIPIVDEIGNELWDERNQSFLNKHYKNFDKLFPYGFD
jgi:uncharacterized protein